MSVYYLTTNCEFSSGVSYVFNSDYYPYESVFYKNEPKQLEIKLGLPGVKKDELELIVEKDILKIVYEGTTDFVQPFEREYTIEGYNGKGAKISLVDGVLEIVMEKKDSYKPKKLKF